MVCFMILLAWFVFYLPNYLGHADNYIPANPAVTPTHIVPEWFARRATGRFTSSSSGCG